MVNISVKVALLLLRNFCLTLCNSVSSQLILVSMVIALLATETRSHFVSDEVFATPLTFLSDCYFVPHSMVFQIYVFANYSA